MNSKKNIQSILFIEFGSVNTRASLFEKKNGNNFSFSGASSVRTTNADLTSSVYEGMIDCIQKLEKASGRKILDQNHTIITPQRPDSCGIDQISAVYSCAGKPAIVLVGVTHDGSCRNMRELLLNAGLKPKAEIAAIDGESSTASIDKILNTDPDMILIGGGTEGGARKALYRLGEIIMLSCRSIPKEQRPVLLFMGNSEAVKLYERVFGRIAIFDTAPNVLEPFASPSQSSFLSFEKTLQDFACSRVSGLNLFRERTKNDPIPCEIAFGRCLRLLSRLTKQNRSVIGIDVGANQTLYGSANNLDLNLSVLPIGMGQTLPEILNRFTLEEIQKKISFQLTQSEIHDYITNKSVHPGLIPSNQYSREVEQVLCRHVLLTCMQDPAFQNTVKSGMISMVLLSGSVLRNVNDPGDSLMIAMDGLHIPGAIDYYLDMNELSSAIGAMVTENEDLAADIASPSSFLYLGKVITPISTAKPGKKILSISIRDESGKVEKFDLTQGTIFHIPLKNAGYYELDWLDIQNGTEISGVKTWTPISFKSGYYGIIFDCRGKDIQLPSKRDEQINILRTWRKEIGFWNDEGQNAG